MKFRIPVFLRDMADGGVSTHVCETVEEAEKLADNQLEEGYGYTDSYDVIDVEYENGKLIYRYQDWNAETFTYEDKSIVFEPIME